MLFSVRRTTIAKLCLAAWKVKRLDSSLFTFLGMGRPNFNTLLLVPF